MRIKVPREHKSRFDAYKAWSSPYVKILYEEVDDIYRSAKNNIAKTFGTVALILSLGFKLPSCGDGNGSSSDNPNPTEKSDFAYASKEFSNGTNYDIVLEENGKKVRVTENPADEGFPRFCKSKRYLLFTRWEDDANLYLLDRVTGDETTVTDERGDNVAGDLSADGRMVCYVAKGSDGSMDIWEFDRVTQSRVNFTDNSGVHFLHPSYSKDMNYIVCSTKMWGNYDLVILDLTTNPLEIIRMTDHPNDEGHPRFSPDNECIVFTRWNPGTGADIHMIDGYNGGQIIDIIVEYGDNLSSDFSPKGDRVIFPAKGPNDDMDVWEMDPWTGVKKNITNNPGHELDPIYPG